MGQPELAALMGYSEKYGASHISNLERGVQSSSFSTVCRLAEYLGPVFVDEIAMVLYNASREGLATKRNKALEQARQANEDLQTVEPPQRPKDLAS